jgi:hypothetical protein
MPCARAWCVSRTPLHNLHLSYAGLHQCLKGCICLITCTASFACGMHERGYSCTGQGMLHTRLIHSTQQATHMKCLSATQHHLQQLLWPPLLPLCAVAGPLPDPDLLQCTIAVQSPTGQKVTGEVIGYDGLMHTGEEQRGSAGTKGELSTMSALVLSVGLVVVFMTACVGTCQAGRRQLVDGSSTSPAHQAQTPRPRPLKLRA